MIKIATRTKMSSGMPTTMEITADADLEIMPVEFEAGVAATVFVTVAVEKGVPSTVTML